MVKLGVDATFWMDGRYEMRFLKLCERAGFDSVWFGDHFLPWHHSFKHNFFVWPVMAAAAERTRKIKVGVDVTVPIGGRYHPAIIAQAASILESAPAKP
jgi:coenzyme F420-dependent glucose-6-phosphate dehydrogenase